jgi:hypothetical protein
MIAVILLGRTISTGQTLPSINSITEPKKFKGN